MRGAPASLVLAALAVTGCEQPPEQAQAETMAATSGVSEAPEASSSASGSGAPDSAPGPSATASGGEAPSASASAGSSSTAVASAAPSASAASSEGMECGPRRCASGEKCFRMVMGSGTPMDRGGASVWFECRRFPPGGAYACQLTATGGTCTALVPQAPPHPNPVPPRDRVTDL